MMYLDVHLLYPVYVCNDEFLLVCMCKCDVQLLKSIKVFFYVSSIPLCADSFSVLAINCSFPFLYTPLQFIYICSVD